MSAIVVDQQCVRFCEVCSFFFLKMPKVKRGSKAIPDGWHAIEPTLEEFDEKIRQGIGGDVSMLSEEYVGRRIFHIIVYSMQHKIFHIIACSMFIVFILYFQEASIFHLTCAFWTHKIYLFITHFFFYVCPSHR